MVLICGDFCTTIQASCLANYKDFHPSFLCIVSMKEAAVWAAIAISDILEAHSCVDNTLIRDS